MLDIVQIVALLLVSVAMALSLAHALELPGKMRLDRDIYIAVQAIYYPGFTFGGLVGELGGMVALAVLVFVTPYGTAAFWWTLAALVLLFAAHLSYWLITHPVNRFWVKDVDLSGAGARFFALFSRGASGNASDWKTLRNIWEYSHVVRAGLAFAALCAIAIASAA